jgi:hypothetical protein
MAAGQSFLEELRDFLAFLRSLWGLLAGISVLFPLSNVLISVIPIDGGGNPFQNIAPSTVTTLTTLSCIFTTFATFGRRSQFSDPERRRRYGWAARLSFGAALVTLAVYTLTYHDLYDLVRNGQASLYDGLYAALYLASFVLITRAFLVLAMLEYFPGIAEDSEPDTRSPR